MPRGHSLSIYARFSGKRELHCNFFSHYNLFLGKRKEKLARKAGVNSERIYRIVLMLPEYPKVQP